MKISPFLFSFQKSPDGYIFPAGHIKGQRAAAQEWDRVARTQGGDVNFIMWYQSPGNNKLHCTHFSTPPSTASS